MDSLPLDRVVLSKRFSVVQGQKIRPVDDATASDLNPRTRLGRAIDHDSIDQLEELARVLVERGCRAPRFWKADVDAAYRRIALRVAARAAAYVVFLYRGKAYAARHNAAFFGATSSVESWARLGARHFALSASPCVATRASVACGRRIPRGGAATRRLPACLTVRRRFLQRRRGRRRRRCRRSRRRANSHSARRRRHPGTKAGMGLATRGARRRSAGRARGIASGSLRP